MAARQFEWDGNEQAEAVWAYACQLGPKETARLRGEEQLNRELELTRTEVLAVVVAHQIRHPSVVRNAREAVDSERALCDGILESLAVRIDELLQGDQAGWFVKTNRHSPKDAPLDEPDERDIQFFRDELARLGCAGPVPRDTDPDLVDFGPAFSAALSSRLRSLNVSSGKQALSLLVRSERVLSDFELQLADDWRRLEYQPVTVGGKVDYASELQQSHGQHGAALAIDCPLTFAPFNSAMVASPLFEFRVFVTARQVRGIAQYQYLHKCPLLDPLAAAEAMCEFVEATILPRLPSDIFDVAVDVTCLPSGAHAQPSASSSTSGASYSVSLIEVNPFGPGCVWGVFNWDKDRHWLMGPSAYDGPSHTSDTAGGETQYLLVRNEGGTAPVVFGIVSAHPLGFVFGGLAHLNAEYLATVYELWALEELLERKPPSTTQQGSWCSAL